MGIGCVLLLWIAGAGVLAGAASVFLGTAAYRLQRGAPGSQRWVVCATFLPFGLLGYGVAAFFGYWIWCESVRGVDPGIGDTWVVPLERGYRLVMVDTPENASIVSAKDETIVNEVAAFTNVEHKIVGETREGRFFIIDLTTGKHSEYGTKEAFASATSRLIEDKRDLESPQTVYRRLRWGWPDQAAVVILSIVPVTVMAVLLRRFFNRLSVQNR